MPGSFRGEVEAAGFDGGVGVCIAAGSAITDCAAGATVLQVVLQQVVVWVVPLAWVHICATVVR